MTSDQQKEVLIAKSEYEPEGFVPKNLQTATDPANSADPVTKIRTFTPIRILVDGIGAINS